MIPEQWWSRRKPQQEKVPQPAQPTTLEKQLEVVSTVRTHGPLLYMEGGIDPIRGMYKVPFPAGALRGVTLTSPKAVAAALSREVSVEPPATFQGRFTIPGFVDLTDIVLDPVALQLFQTTREKFDQGPSGAAQVFDIVNRIQSGEYDINPRRGFILVEEHDGRFYVPDPEKKKVVAAMKALKVPFAPMLVRTQNL